MQLIIVLHGLLGAPKHLTNLISAVTTAGNTLGATVFVAQSYQVFLSYDGIDVCARRVFDELELKVKELQAQGKTIDEYSVVGYSLGGLIARYLIALIHAHKEYSNWKPINFITLATPHLGIKSTGETFRQRLTDNLAPLIVSRSGNQLVLKDTYRDSGMPLLLLMASPTSRFYEALSEFKYRSVYSNTINDRTVHFWTANIMDVDTIGPWMIVNVTDRSMTLSTKYPGIVESFSEPREDSSKVLATIPGPRKAAFLLLSPILVLGVVGVSTYAGVASKIRQKKVIPSFQAIHTVSKAAPAAILPSAVQDNDSISSSNGKSSNATAVPGDLSQRLLDAMEDDNNSITQSDVLQAENQFSQHAKIQTEDTSLDISPTIAPNVHGCTVMPHFSSPKPGVYPKLSQEQQEMARSLNLLGWTKYPVKLDHFRSHAAIVARSGDEDWWKIGQGVLKHLTEVGFKH